MRSNLLIIIAMLFCSVAGANEKLRYYGTPVPAEKLDAEWKSIRLELITVRRGWAHNKYFDVKINWAYGTEIVKHLDTIFSYLKNTDRIRYYDEHIANILKDSKRPSCHSSSGPKSIYAFYLPNENVIFIDPNYKANKSMTFGQALLHEVIHAYQYSVRFPVDVNTVYQLTQTQCENGPCLYPNDVAAFLSFVYESQANWYVMQLQRNDVWMEYALSRKTKESFARDFSYTLPGMVKRLVFDVPLSFMKSPLILNYKDSETYNPAFVDDGKDGQLDWFASIFSTSELIVQDTFFVRAQPLMVDYTITFQAHVAKRILENYYCSSLDFAFDPSYQDQKSYTEIHNNYYRNFGSIPLIPIPQCKDLILNAIVSDNPMQYWLTRSESELKSCIAYRNVKPEALEFFSKKMSSTNNPFKILPGTCGSRGCGQDISPGIMALPQIEFEP